MAYRYLVTGASRGVGHAVAEALAARGDVVIGWSRSGTAPEIASLHPMAVDVTDAGQVTEAFAQLRNDQLLPDVAFLAAGATAASPALHQRSDQFERVLAVNVVGAFNVAREALRGMVRKGFGRIVLVSSINTRIHSAGGVAYNASKAAVEEMGRCLAGEARIGDVTVNTLGLSLVAGEGMAAGLTEAEVARKVGRLTKTEPIDVTAVLHAMDFLASPQASAITGESIFFGGAL